MTHCCRHRASARRKASVDQPRGTHSVLRFAIAQGTNTEWRLETCNSLTSMLTFRHKQESREALIQHFPLASLQLSGGLLVPGRIRHGWQCSRPGGRRPHRSGGVPRVADWRGSAERCGAGARGYGPEVHGMARSDLWTRIQSPDRALDGATAGGSGADLRASSLGADDSAHHSAVGPQDREREHSGKGKSVGLGCFTSVAMYVDQPCALLL